MNYRRTLIAAAFCLASTAALATQMNDQIAKLHHGMDMAEVNKIMGTPYPIMDWHCRDDVTGRMVEKCRIVEYVVGDQKVTIAFRDDDYSLIKVLTPEKLPTPARGRK